jgi:hypothetical protein
MPDFEIPKTKAAVKAMAQVVVVISNAIRGVVYDIW